MQQTTSAAYRLSKSSQSQEMDSNADRPSGSREAVTLEQPAQSQQSYRVRLEDSPRLPFNGELPYMVRTLLRRGSRRIVLDLAVVWRIDAAGIGELVRAYNIAIAANAALRIANTNPRVREMLERVGLFDRLNAGPNDTTDPDRADRDIFGASDTGSRSLKFSRRAIC
jgi:ABC-type transporter Mla MlaB component